MSLTTFKFHLHWCVFWLKKYLILIGFFFTLSSIVIAYKLSFCEFIVTLCQTYVISSVFYFFTVFVPSLEFKKEASSYKKTKLNEIYRILEFNINRIILFMPYSPRPSLNTYINQFKRTALFKRNTIGEPTIYERIIINCNKVRDIASDLLLHYNQTLNYNDTCKLRYLRDKCHVDEDLSNHLVQIEGDVMIDENLITLQAIRIYKAYEITCQKRFHEPVYPIELQIINQLNNEWCM